MNSFSAKVNIKPNSVKEKASVIPNSFTESHILSNVLLFLFANKLSEECCFFPRFLIKADTNL